MVDPMDSDPDRTCRICGNDLTFLAEKKMATCSICGEPHGTDRLCRDGHFVCDDCCQAPAAELISTFCGKTDETDPVAIARTLMDMPQLSTQESEQQFLISAALLAAFLNVRGTPGEKPGKIEQARLRVAQIRGDFCGIYGDCGSAAGTGIFVSIVTGATPLSKNEWMLSNLATAKSLEAVALQGGPRCCRRNAFIAILSAVRFSQERFGVVMPVRQPVTCGWLFGREACPARDCPFLPV
ncbi:MAG TPA: DUF5714 domain-containing protein [Methanoregulaceae archaeon]|nr:DUF5714 domain-containing protein [Methanoregulaceae archaeon]HRY76216.1 DUF5714 domain-containing protein [Methanoregulaceae archaeon]